MSTPPATPKTNSRLPTTASTDTLNSFESRIIKFEHVVPHDNILDELDNDFLI
jgi:hypothetical protein